MRDARRPFSKRYEHGFTIVLDNHRFHAYLGSLVGSQHQECQVNSFLLSCADSANYPLGPRYDKWMASRLKNSPKCQYSSAGKTF